MSELACGEGVADPEGSGLPMYAPRIRPRVEPRGKVTMGFPAGPAAVGQARERTGRALAAWRIPLVVDDTAAVVSELMTNAVIHTVGRRVELVLTCGDGLLLVEVRDESTLPPTPVRNAGDDAEGGRGLQLVDALASDWGWLPLNQKRKAVWALLAVHRAVSVATA